MGSIGMVLIGCVMLRSRIFSKSTGIVGIASGLVGFGMYVPKVGIIISMLSVVGMQIWYVMIALKLMQLSRRVAVAPPVITTA